MAVTRVPLLVSRFERIAGEVPDRLAVRASDGDLTFADLATESARLATMLRLRGVSRGDRVGVGVPRGCGLVAALLGVWRAGAAYVPMDPRYPADRLRSMAADADVRVLVTSEGISGPGDEAVRAPGAATGPAASDPAYAIFTSGSTGRPKAVEVTQGAVAALVASLETFGAYSAEQRVVAWNASVAFDASVKQWVRVCRGDTVVVVADEDRIDPERLRAVLDRYSVTDLDLTPSHWELLRDMLLRTDRAGGPLRLFMGGEPIPRRTWREIADAGARGVLEGLNLYGPTECTVDATAAWISGAEPHIGTFLPGMRGYVLDGALRPVADGEDGELYLAGPQLALGYVNRQELTAARFVADPFGEPGGRMYRTGDTVRRTPTGMLEFVGRTDDQVKINGYRVEPGEIESVLEEHPALAKVVVRVRHSEEAGGQLVAYCVPRAQAAPTPSELRSHAAGSLPDFMVPARYLILRQLPLTPNGKLDLAALDGAVEPPATEDAAWLPSGDPERLIAGVWSEVLGCGEVTADDDFFALGGSSLLALRVVTRLKEGLGIRIRTRDIYRHPRLSDLAGYAGALPRSPASARSEA
jgi:amino acid adenylation domain-containing protein